MEDVEVGLRREAVRRRLAGESPEVIARELGRTRQWVGKWTARYDANDPGWAQGRSHAARRVANRTDVEIEVRVVAVRAKLEANPWAQVGAPAVAWELDKLGAVVPPLRTIERILGRAGTTGRPRAGRRASKGIHYPAPTAKRPGDVAQVDLVGPRHLDGGVRFHALNQIDVASHHAGIEIVEDRGDERVIAALHALWARHGVPGRVQFDNGGPFTSPTGVGEVVRFCLHQGATPVFIPPREPWRNGTIERFNDTFDKRFFRQERFADRQQLVVRAGAFEAFHNSQHRYRATNGRAPGRDLPVPPPARAAGGRRAARRLAAGRPHRVHPLHPLRPQAATARPRHPDARRPRIPVPHRHPGPVHRPRHRQPAGQRRARRAGRHQPPGRPTPLTPPRTRTRVGGHASGSSP
jgi:putative transposase